MQKLIKHCDLAFFLTKYCIQMFSIKYSTQLSLDFSNRFLPPKPLKHFFFYLPISLLADVRLFDPRSPCLSVRKQITGPDSLKNPLNLKTFINEFRRATTYIHSSETIFNGIGFICLRHPGKDPVELAQRLFSLVFFGHCSTMTKWTYLFAGRRKMMIPH
jgi:hypothetical protein